MFRLYFLVILFTQVELASGQMTGTKPANSVDSPRDSAKNQQADSGSYIPRPIGWTNDYKNLYTKEEVSSLDSLIADYERKTTVEISVATIDSAMMGFMDFESYTLLMLRTWGVGKQQSNNGILIVIAPDLRRVRIQNGYGIEKVLTNNDTRAIIDSVMTPSFRKNNFFYGTKAGILAIIGKLEQKGG